MNESSMIPVNKTGNYVYMGETLRPVGYTNFDMNNFKVQFQLEAGFFYGYIQLDAGIESWQLKEPNGSAGMFGSFNPYQINNYVNVKIWVPGVSTPAINEGIFLTLHYNCTHPELTWGSEYKMAHVEYNEAKLNFGIGVRKTFSVF